MTAILATQIELDAEGVAWIGGTKTKVTEIVLDKMAHGWSLRRFISNIPICLWRKSTER